MVPRSKNEGIEMTKLMVYEWLVEEVDEYGDVVDLDYRDTAAEALASMQIKPGEGLHYEWGIERREYDSDDPGEIIGRQWAYVEDGSLPLKFDAGVSMPKRYAVEFAKAVACKHLAA